MSRLLSVLALVSSLVAVGLLARGESPGALDEEALWEEASLYFEPLPEVADNPRNPVTPAKVELGRKLYFDPALSSGGEVSCNSCHSLATFGVDRLPTSPGVGGQLGSRNSPTVLNAAFHESQFWDGRAADVEEQAGMPILNPVEMAIPSPQALVETLEGKGYRDAFKKAFPGDPEPLSWENVRLALAAFERTLITPAPFDAYLRGDKVALGPRERVGLKLFIESGCASCHNGINLGAASFRKFGLNDEYWVHTKSEPVDPGRYSISGDESDLYVFRVASLRNVAETGPYFHDGSVESLAETVDIMVRLQVGYEPTLNEVQSMVSFLESLTGELPPEVREGISREVEGE